jgi:rubrerythrin
LKRRIKAKLDKGEWKIRERHSVWTCEICGHDNLDEEDICEECGSYREESSYDAISDEED